MRTTEVSGEYIRFSQLGYLIVRDPVAAQVLAVDGVLAALKPSLAPDGPPGINRARRKLARGAQTFLRRRRLHRLVPWSKRIAPDALELSRSARKVWAALGTLKPRQQIAVVMARLEGSTLAEIADALDCSAAAANSYLESAAETLGRELGAADLRRMLTRELRTIAQAFVAAHSPDPAVAERVLQRTRRWRTAGIAMGVAAAAGAAVLVSLLRG